MAAETSTLNHKLYVRIVYTKSFYFAVCPPKARMKHNILYTFNIKRFPFSL